jgi:hypothetical protein
MIENILTYLCDRSQSLRNAELEATFKLVNIIAQTRVQLAGSLSIVERHILKIR